MATTITTDDYWSGLYDEGRDYRFITSGELSKILSYADSKLPKACLDVGCGTGQLLRELFHRGYECVGVDAATSAIHLANSLTTVLPPQLQYLHYDIEHDDISKLPITAYSLITCKFVYKFIKDKPAFLKKVKSLLAPGGIFVVITPQEIDVAVERRNIAVSDEELSLLGSHFEQIALYKGNEPGGALTYFIGR